MLLPVPLLVLLLALRLALLPVPLALRPVLLPALLLGLRAPEPVAPQAPEAAAAAP